MYKIKASQHSLREAFKTLSHRAGALKYEYAENQIRFNAASYRQIKICLLIMVIDKMDLVAQAGKKVVVQYVEINILVVRVRAFGYLRPIKSNF